MEEQITDKVGYELRLIKVDEAALFGLMTNERIALSEYIAGIVEQAYIAGANHYVAGSYPIQGLSDIGYVKVLAQNFVKFKGFRK